jgi:hypothetical protein
MPQSSKHVEQLAPELERIVSRRDRCGGRRAAICCSATSTTTGSGPRRGHRHSDDLRRSGLRSRQADPAGGYGAATLLAHSECGRESRRSALSCHPLGYQAAAGTSGRESWRAGRLDQHCDDVNHAETFLGAPALMSWLQRPPRRRARRHRTGVRPCGEMLCVRTNTNIMRYLSGGHGTGRRIKSS